MIVARPAPDRTGTSAWGGVRVLDHSLPPIFRSDFSRMPGGRRLRLLISPGFTLIEILVVIVVIAVLASMVAPNVFKHFGEAKNVTARSQIEMLGAALDAYRLDNGRYPTAAQGL